MIPSRGKTPKETDFSNEHNSLVPIGCLTDDVLGEIFFHHVSTYFWRCSVSKAHKLSLSYEKHPLEPFSGLTNFYDWKNISQVCRRWWQMFNNSPHLFGFIVYKRLSWDFRQMMERASNNGAPVYIRFAEARITTSEMRQVRTMFGLIERAHLLRLDVPRRVYSCLESLGVNAKEWTHLHTISFSEGSPFPDEVDDPVSFFADANIPKLCKVIGSQCSLGPIRSIIRPSVTHLSLERLYQDTTLLCLTEVLASLPRLEVLSLSHVVGGVPWSKKSKTRPGKTKLIKIPSLEHLTHLYVSSPITECAYILDYIKFPQDTVLELELHEETGDQYPSDIFELALKQIDSRLQEIEFFPPMQPLTTFAGTPYRVRSPQSVQECFKLQWWSTKQSLQCLPHGNLNGYRGSISVSYDFFSFFKHIALPMPLEEIEVLYVGDMGWDHPIKEGKLWIRSIEADPESDPPFSALEQLVLDSTNPETATHMITEVLTGMRDVSEEDQDEEVGDKDGDGCSEQAMFPLLKIIVLRHLDVDPTSTTLGKKLLRALKIRNKHSKPIDKLCIESEFEVTDECLERFGKLVGEVEYTEIPEEVEREPDWLTQMKAWQKRDHSARIFRKGRKVIEEEVNDDDTIASLWSTDDDEGDEDLETW